MLRSLFVMRPCGCSLVCDRPRRYNTCAGATAAQPGQPGDQPHQLTCRRRQPARLLSPKIFLNVLQRPSPNCTHKNTATCPSAAHAVLLTLKRQPTSFGACLMRVEGSVHSNRRTRQHLFVSSKRRSTLELRVSEQGERGVRQGAKQRRTHKRTGFRVRTAQGLGWGH